MRRPSLLLVPAALALTLLLTWPLARDLGRAMPANGEPMDALLQSWILAWDWQSLANHPRGVFDAPIFHPERRTLTSMDSLLGQAVLGWPVWRATGSVPAAYGGVLILAFVGTAWATYRLARALAVSRGAAFLAAFLYTFSAYRLSNIGNLNQASTQWVPLALFFAVRFLARRRARDGALALLTVGLQAWFGWYYVFHLVVAMAIVFAVFVLTRNASPAAEARNRRPLGNALILAAGAVVAVLIAWPVTRPYLEQRAAMPGFQRTLGEAALYSADLLDYLRTHREAWVAAWMPWRAGGQAYGLGLVTLILGVFGARAMLRDRARGLSAPALPEARRPEWVFIVAVGVAGFVLSLGPLLTIAGHRLPVPLPYAALHLAAPGFASMRAPGRFAELALLAAVAVAALGLDRLARGLGGRACAGLLVACWAVALAEGASMPLRMVAFPDVRAMPEVYRWLARQPGATPILELPMPATEDDEAPRDLVRQIYGLAHGKPRVDGVSGFTPPTHRRFRLAMQAFPADSAIALARARAVRWVVVRAAEIEEPARSRVLEAIARTPVMAEVARFGSDHVFVLR